MTIRIDPADERAIYVQIMDEIKRALVLGTLQPDEPLPSVRQLSSDLKVNPNTIKHAYRELEHEGLVRAERGRGTFVSHTSQFRPNVEKMAVARAVAQRAVRDAYRHGLTETELIEAIQKTERDTERDSADGKGVA